MAILRNGLILLLSWALLACSTTPAPVIDRLPATKQNTASKSLMGKVTGDWRPDTYTVKKGDTLFSLGLEYGYDYKEIAQLNDIKAPYIIKIGQTLKFNTLKDKSTNVENNVVQEQTNGVTTYAIGNDSSSSTTTQPPQVLALSEPKAIREPYSDEAFKKPLPMVKPDSVKVTTATKPVAPPTPNITEKASETRPKVITEPKVEANAEPTTSGDWIWPTKGKVIANFNDAGNKGIDIAGSMGQSINAAAAGKVIYSGSDLRGYGKLVIIKHNATYLSVYAHNSLIVVKEGQAVTRGQKIAEMGNTDSNTVKLHFEIRQQGKSVDPSKFLASN
ncbi:MAG: peptidoglycan DD-metalloendopeptidase family protein [Methylotenera sp.]|nr:peptidoglycan DD-metalloendopeptidase family protein [Methylotenera sp.]MDO9389539.1 peptidoglycan DD-metalloendopeptidase family protein [Methylotenera sp.]